MTPLENVCGFLAKTAPLKLAEDWDNVGLLIGDRKSEVGKIMTCLTISPSVVNEAVEQKVDLIVAHHPLPFQPIKKITSDNTTGSMLLSLIRHGISVYSSHTAFDSAEFGINQRWCDRLGVTDTKPLITPPSSGSRTSEQAADIELGSGRYGILRSPETLAELSSRAATSVGGERPRLVGDANRKVTKIAFACGSGGSFLAAAIRSGCHALVTGEATFHVCLEAESREIGLILLGHYFSERFAMEELAETLNEEFPDLRVWASEQEQDPFVGN